MLNTKFKAAHKCTALLLSLLMLASMAVLPVGADEINLFPAVAHVEQQKKKDLKLAETR